MIKKLIAGGAVVAAVLLYVLFGNRGNTSASISDNSGLNDISAATSTETPNPTPTPTPVPTPKPKGQYKDGTYKGSVVDVVYGSVQAEAVISGGKLADVKLLQYPNSGGHTSEVSQFALPQLVQEAIAAQSAQVDVVSGATQTSEGFQQSLGAALSSAQA